jgi:hypothetical protein
MRLKHLTEEIFLALAGGRLSGDDLRAVDKHLAECAKCRENFADFRFAHSVVKRMAEIGYQEALGEPDATPARPARTKFEFPWGPASAIAAGSLCVMLFLFLPKTIPTASASELLSSAIKYEDRVGDKTSFRIQVSGQTCVSVRLSGTMVSSGQSLSCNRALREIQKTPWGSGNPLSAKTYAQWRNSLHQHHDHVTKLEKSWEIETATDEGAVHAARLELDAHDYHTSKVTVAFAYDEISIAEETEMAPSAPPVSVANEMPKPQHLDDASDMLEAHAWTKLHQLGADSGWEALVIRSGLEVRVKAVVHDDARFQEFKNTFAAYPEIALDVRLYTAPGDVRDLFPERLRAAEDAPALATTWLKEKFPDANLSTEYSNQVLHQSQEILGRAYFLDQLRHRQIALAHCTCENEIASLIRVESHALSGLAAGLSANLDPLIGSPSNVLVGTLTLEDAKRLDASLHELLWRSSVQTDATFDTSVQEVRGLLTKD